MNRILEILNEENYEDIELYANTKEELENKVIEYFQENDEEFTINDVENIAWQGEGSYSIGGKPLGEIYVELTSECQKLEFKNIASLKDNFYVADKIYFDNDEIEILDEFSMKTYGKHCISEDEYNYKQELKKRYNFSDDLIEKIINKQEGVCYFQENLEEQDFLDVDENFYYKKKDVTEQDFYNEYKEHFYLGYEPNSLYYYFLNKDLKTLYYIRSYYDRNYTELE